MNSGHAERADLLGVQQPRVSLIPQYTTTTGDEAIELAALAGLYLDPWQQEVLRVSLGESPGWKCSQCTEMSPLLEWRCPFHQRLKPIHPWAAFEVGVMVSRQNGKGGILEARELAGLFLLGEKLIVHSAHEFATSIEHFNRLTFLIENTPELAKRLPPGRSHGINRSHGFESIKLRNGQRINFRTRTKGGARGFTADCVVLDEAMDIPDAKLAAILPTLSTVQNPQVWYTGSAVDQERDDNGIVFARVRERGHEGSSPRLAYFEWSADLDINKLTRDDTKDIAHWAQANPALGIRISTQFIESERAAFGSARGFAVERLGVGDWPRTDDLSISVIDPELWAAEADHNSQVLDPVSFAIDVTPDRATATIGMAGERADGHIHVEVIDSRRGTGWVVPRLKELLRWRPYGFFIDPGSPAGSLVPEIEDAVGMNAKGDSLLVIVTAKEYAQGCGIFFDAVGEDKLRHLDTEGLNAAVEGAKIRPLGGAWAWDARTSEVNISPLVAVTLAAFGNSKRPKKKARVINLNNL